MPSGNAPAETAGVAHSLCFRQISLTPQEGVLGVLALYYFLCQLAIDGCQLAGSFFDAALKCLLQMLDFSLSLFVSGGFDDIPSPASLCYRELMCSHHIQNFIR